jgi:hypothetical protein
MVSETYCVPSCSAVILAGSLFGDNVSLTDFRINLNSGHPHFWQNPTPLLSELHLLQTLSVGSISHQSFFGGIPVHSLGNTRNSGMGDPRLHRKEC